MNDILDEKAEKFDVSSIIAEQVAKGAELSKIQQFDYDNVIPSRKLFKIDQKENEIVEKRDHQSKTFQINENNYKLVVDKAIIHFQDDDGIFKEVNLFIRDVRGKKIMNSANYKVEVFTDRVGYRLKQRGTNSWFTIELEQIGKMAPDFSNLSSKVEGNHMTWTGFSQDLSMKLVLNSDNPQIYSILESPNAAKKFRWKIEHEGNFSFSSFGNDNNGDSTELVTSTDVVNDSIFIYSEEWTGRVARINDKKTRIKSYYDDPFYPVIIDPTATLNIAANNDDGGKTTFNANWLPNSPAFGHSTTSNFFTPGFRFTSIAIPTGVTVSSATLTLQIRTYISASAAPGKIWGDNVDNAAAWSTSDLPAGITKTSSSTNYSPTKTVNAVDNIDVTAQVTQILARGGWASGNAMRFAALSNTGGGTNNYVNFYDFNTTPAKAAQLVINYTTGSSFIARPNPYQRQALKRASSY